MKPSYGKGNVTEEKTESFADALLPFLKEEISAEDKPAQTDLGKAGSSAPKKPARAEEILSEIGSINPLQSLKNSVKQMVIEGASEEEENPVTEVLPTEIKPADEKVQKKPIKIKKTSSLLAKCMPYIYDDKGINYAEEKPDYTLESVEDIIESAEKRADQKIARMYNLKASDIKRIGSDEKPVDDTPDVRPKVKEQATSVKKAVRIGDITTSVSAGYDTLSIPKVSDTLFDDFSGRRTDVSGEESVTSPYSANSRIDDGQTRVLPDFKSNSTGSEEYEDILSHTRPVGVVDISSSSTKPKTVSGIINASEEQCDIQVEEFKGPQDINRVGSMLKKNVFTSRVRFLATLFLTAVATALNIPTVKNTTNSTALGVTALIVFLLALAANCNIFAGFKNAFTAKSRIELPLALAASVTAVYMVYSIILGQYPYEPVLIPLISFLVFDWCSYRKNFAIFENFKLIASKKPKKAVSLIDDVSVTAAMARSVISGEILAAGEQETEQVDDFLKNTLSDRPFAGKMNILAIVSVVAAVLIAPAAGVVFGSFDAVLLAAAMVMNIAAAPTVFIADMLPFAGISDKLQNWGAGVCSKYSAERIEQANAVVVSSAELFPDGCIKLYNMTPLSANPLDETIVLATAVAQSVNSPLYPMLKKILTDETSLPEADSVKYEDNLGLSGWVGNNHIMIGNRSLMQAHGVRVPALEVDRKILHRGYFPVYIACDQRACALLVVGYSVDADIEAELAKLSNRGVVLLVNNCDPNITEQMLCDYYSLYSDLVKILDNFGSQKYKSATEHTERVSAHGFNRGGIHGFISIITGSMKLRVLSNILYAVHIVATVVIWLLFAGMSLGSMAIMSTSICALCELIGAVVALTAYFAGK